MKFRFVALIGIAGMVGSACSVDKSPKAPQSAEIKRSPEQDPFGNNDPMWFGITGNMKYSQLAEAYHLDYVPWAGDYWATAQGGISIRWQGGCSGENCLYELPSKAEYLAMTKDEIAKLSPTEKYDLMNGYYNLEKGYTATGKERAFIRYKQSQHDNDIPGWTGICNGWSLAALYEKEPMEEVTVTNPDGLEVTFYEGDLKALMSQIYFDYQPNIVVNRLGNGCFDEDDSYACEDTNPKTWMLALHKYLAKGKAFVFDKYAGDEVWNQPIYGYKDFSCKNHRRLADEPRYKHAAPGTKYLVDCSMTVQYITEGRPRTKPLPEGGNLDHISENDYTFTLELDKRDYLLGGEWTSDDRPDFMWKPSQLPSDSLLGDDYPISYSRVKDLIEKSRKGLE